MNLQMEPVQPTALPTLIYDRGGAGPNLPRFEIIDYIEAMSLFPVVAGEHPVDRAARQHRFLFEVLPKLREARERREAAVFLAGAVVGESVASERFQAEAQAQMYDAYGRPVLPPIMPVPIVVTPYGTVMGASGDDRGSKSSGWKLIAALGIPLVVGLVGRKLSNYMLETQAMFEQAMAEAAAEAAIEGTMDQGAARAVEALVAEPLPVSAVAAPSVVGEGSESVPAVTAPSVVEPTTMPVSAVTVPSPVQPA